MLSPGSVIGAVAFGSPVKQELFEQGLKELQARGYQVLSPFDPSKRYGSFKEGFASATKEVRAQAFHSLLEDEKVSAIMAVRGGYGSIELLELIDFQKIRKYPKPIIGYSDLTVLLVTITAFSNVVTIHGSTIASECALAGTSPTAKESVDELFQLLTDQSYHAQYLCKILRAGQATGRILAGNLAMLLTLLGTPWDVSYDGAILVLEDVNEAPYRIHRALMQLKLAGKLENLAGVVFGRFSYSCAKNQKAHADTMEELFELSLQDIFKKTQYPILFGFEFGHQGRNIPLPLGCQARIDGELFQILESGVT